MLMVGGQLMPSNILVLIPCRLNSRRLPGKALKMIGGIPIIHHVYKNTKIALENASLKADLAVCTDSNEIIDYLKTQELEYYETSSIPINGTERICEAIKKYNLDYDYYIDVQGDEPFINSEILNCVTNELFKFHYSDDVIVLPHQLISFTEANRESIVKLVLNNKNNVMYMTRSLVPYKHIRKESEKILYKKHLSVIGFTSYSIKKYTDLENSYCQSIEDIELLKALENETDIVSPLSTTNTFSIDTEEDFTKACQLIENGKIS